MASQKNYLQSELDALIRADDGAWSFLQKGSLDGIWYWDLEHPENEWMSPEFWRLFGVDPATKRHDPAEWQDIIFKNDLNVALANFEAHCADPDVPYDQIVRYRHADGSVVWVRCRGIAIRDAQGKPIRMLGAHNDITAVKRSEEIARQNARQAEAANADLRAFSYSVSHDLKAPTNTLKLLLNELEHEATPALDDDTKDLLALCRQTVDRMQIQVDDVLSYTRLISTNPEFSTVALADCAGRATDNLQADIQATGAQVRVGTLPEVKACRTQMSILFQNLLANAIKFCEPGSPPEIHIDCELRDERYDITVRDNGIGIPAKDSARIFGLFQRLHTRETFDGSGIGLSMCQRIAHNHKGHIYVAANPSGQGTAFTVSLPRGLR